MYFHSGTPVGQGDLVYLCGILAPSAHRWWGGANRWEAYSNEEGSTKEVVNILVINQHA